VEFALILMLILFNGALALSEIAMVSARRSRLEEMSEQGVRGSRRALALQQDSGRLLSTIQVGITLVGVMMGALGESALAGPLRELLGSVPLLADSADSLALILVVLGITYLSVVAGELVPKELALLAPERLAVRVAPPLALLARIAAPLVWLLAGSSRALLKLLGAQASEEPPVSNEEIRVLMAQGAEAGVFYASEREIVSNVLRLDEQRVGVIMTPRQDIQVLDLSQAAEDLHGALARLDHTLVPVCHGGVDGTVLGVLKTTDLLSAVLDAGAAGGALSEQELLAVLHPPLFVPESVSNAQLLEIFASSRINLALIVDEYGSLEGLVTLADVLAAIVGTPLGDDSDAANDIVQRADGSWLVDGALSLDRLREALALRAPLPGEDGLSFHTVGGLVLHHLGRLPRVGDSFSVEGLAFEVVDMDRKRVDRVLLTVAPPASEAGETPSASG